MRISDSVFLVTGSSRGIGEAIAAQLGQRGAQVLLHGRCVDRLDANASALGAKALDVDLTGRGAAEELALRALDVYGRVDGVVHAAGVGWCGATADMPPGSVEELVSVNLVAAVQLTRCLLPGMIRAGRGHVSFVASIAGLTGVAREAVYSATKAAVVTFADSLRLELAGIGVGVSVISPGAVDTEFCATRGVPYQRRFPRPIPPQRVAAVVVRSIERDRPSAVVPSWLRAAPATRAAVPSLYRVLARRFG